MDTVKLSLHDLAVSPLAFLDRRLALQIEFIIHYNELCLLKIA